MHISKVSHLHAVALMCLSLSFFAHQVNAIKNCSNCRRNFQYVIKENDGGLAKPLLDESINPAYQADVLSKTSSRETLNLKGTKHENENFFKSRVIGKGARHGVSENSRKAEENFGLLQLSNPKTGTSDSEIHDTPESLSSRKRTLEISNAMHLFPPYYETGASTRKQSPHHLRKCISILDPDICNRELQCFYDIEYRKCFAKCLEIEDMEKCELVTECRLASIPSKHKCINDGYQAYSFEAPLKGFSRGCAFFLKEAACNEMRESEHSIKGNFGSKKHEYQVRSTMDSLSIPPCKWIGSKNEENTSYLPAVCVSTNSVMPKKELDRLEQLVKSAKELEDIENKEHLNEDKICQRVEIPHSVLDPDQSVYKQGDQIKIKCNAGFLLSSGASHAECKDGLFQPATYCLPIEKLTESEIQTLKRISRVAGRKF